MKVFCCSAGYLINPEYFRQIIFIANKVFRVDIGTLSTGFDFGILDCLSSSKVIKRTSSKNDKTNPKQFTWRSSLQQTPHS